MTSTLLLRRRTLLVLGECGPGKEYPLDTEPDTGYHPDLIVLGVPVQYWDIPNSAKRLIENLPPFKGSSAFVFSTFGKCVINPVPFLLAKELIEKGCTIMGGGQIVAPHAAKVDGRQRLGDMEIAFGKGQPDDAVLSQFTAVIQLPSS